MLKTGLKRTPIAICGLALGVMALSNLFYNLNLTLFGLSFFIISCAILLIVILKWIVYPTMFLKELKNINTFAILPALPMTLMILVSIVKTQFLVGAYILNVIWYVSILLHMSFIIIFIGFYAFRNYKSWPNTSWFVMFVGIGVIGETSSAFNTSIGNIAIILGSIFLILILGYVLFTKAWQTYNQEQFPMVIIMSAPAALCLNSYILNHSSYSVAYVSAFLVLSQLLFLFTLIFLPKIMKEGFKVSFSALTFPWVTTAASLYNVNQNLNLNDTITNLVNVISIIEIIWATLIVVYVLYKYILFLILKNVVYG
ncbi:MAG TPA: TDT family transporter [Mammaliicoccus lentus]|nr:TDT family transporter [Mammaliicoccus lentus]HJF22660.1 TDT family transporter [Mammaliicoccus lentus]